MRFEQYLTEGRSKKINKEEVKKLLRTKYSDAFKLWKNHSEGMWRGNVSVDEKFAEVKPSQHSRESANTTNHYTLHIDNSKKWKSYPKRSKSIIGSSQRSGAYGGNKYLVLPENGAKMGIASSEDFWGSFRDTYKDGLDEFNDDFENIHTEITGKATKTDTNYATLKKSLKTVTDGWNNMSDGERENVGQKPWGGTGSFAELMFQFNDAEKVFDYVLDPKVNQIKKDKAGDRLPSHERETWTDGDSLMINDDIIRGQEWQDLMEEMHAEDLAKKSPKQKKKEDDDFLKFLTTK